MKRLLALLLLCPAGLPAREVRMPEIQGIVRWLNTDRPLAADDLKGKVVLVDFWTYSCINCIRTFPHVTAWHEKYKDRGLVIVGVHSPEFAFEKDEANVRAALKKYGIAYPVAMDNDHKTWKAFSNRYWPAHYLADRNGVVRYSHFGEGNYEETEDMIRRLLAEGGSAPEAATSAAPAADLSGVKTPEIYVGYRRLEALANKERVHPDKSRPYRAPASPPLHRFALDGVWRVGPEFAALDAEPGRVLLRYEAGQAHMVMDGGGGEIVGEVFLDGLPLLPAEAGKDVAVQAGRALCRVREARLYHLTRHAPGRRLLELRFSKPGVRAYSFTFG